MAYNPDAMTIIVSGDLPPEMAEKLQSQLTADVLTAQEFAQREQTLEKQQEVEHDTAQNRADAGLDGEEGDEFAAPDEGEVDNVDVADTSGDEGGDESTDDLGGDDSESAEEDGDESEEDSSDDVADVDEADHEEVSEEDKQVKDDLDEPNAAFEHAQALGTKEVGRYLRLGVAKYKRRVRRQRLILAQETLQMEAAQRQKLIRRLLYVKPTDSGFTSKLQTFISTISNPDDWVALVDSDASGGSQTELTKKQITEALEKAGIEMYDSVDTLADSFNQLQKSITEPAGTESESTDF